MPASSTSGSRPATAAAAAAAAEDWLAWKAFQRGATPVALARLDGPGTLRWRARRMFAPRGSSAEGETLVSLDATSEGVPAVSRSTGGRLLAVDAMRGTVMLLVF